MTASIHSSRGWCWLTDWSPHHTTPHPPLHRVCWCQQTALRAGSSSDKKWAFGPFGFEVIIWYVLGTNRTSLCSGNGDVLSGARGLLYVCLFSLLTYYSYSVTHMCLLSYASAIHRVLLYVKTNIQGVSTVQIYPKISKLHGGPLPSCFPGRHHKVPSAWPATQSLK